MQKKKNIVVNATALDIGGALTILKQFIQKAGMYKYYHFYCFIPENVKVEDFDNITYFRITKMGWINRIFWDFYSLTKKIDEYNINPEKIISLQNTSVNSVIPQIIYLHQPLPFSSVKWSIFKKSQFTLFLYKHFYKFFILLFVNKATVFVVQTQWMKDALCLSGKVSSNNIHVIKPEINLPKKSFIKADLVIENEYKKILYPASTLFYKNHLIILKAMKELHLKHELKDTVFQVTFNEGDYLKFDAFIKSADLLSFVEYLGVIPYEQLIQKYRECTFVVFPSYVETYGLPLAEAATLGKVILCSSLPYAKDVLNGYPGATYLDYEDPIAWENAIKNTLQKIGSTSFEGGDFKFPQTSSWDDFFKLI